MSSELEECIALWREAQRSPSIIGYNVHQALPENIHVTMYSNTVHAEDVRLWDEKHGMQINGQLAGPDPSGLMFLELVFLHVPEEWDKKKFGEACAEKLDAFLKEAQLSEFRSKLKEHQEGKTVRRRNAAASDAADEGGDVKEDSWKEFIGRRREPHPPVTILSVHDIGAKGRPIIACRFSLTPGASRELGKLAYPTFFKEKTEKELKAEDQFYNFCYYGCMCFMAFVLLIWLLLITRALTRSNPHQPKSPQQRRPDGL